jgi:hypothetical protein
MEVAEYAADVERLAKLDGDHPPTRCCSCDDCAAYFVEIPILCQYGTVTHNAELRGR